MFLIAISPELPIISYHKSLEVSTGEHIFKDIAHVLVELGKFTKNEEALKSEEDHWLYFLSRWSVAKSPPKTLKDPLILEAYNQLETFSLSEEEYKLYLDAKTLAEKEAANLELEYNKGREEGIEIGKEKGREEGREEGRELRNIEIAKSMLSNNLSVDTISGVTGLSLEQINALK